MSTPLNTTTHIKILCECGEYMNISCIKDDVYQASRAGSHKEITASCPCCYKATKAWDDLMIDIERSK